MLHPVATEGGHADFAPPDDEAVAFLRWMREKLEHVSAERVASGIGLHLLYKYHHGAHSGSAEPHLQGGEEEIPARMAEEAARGGCASCVLAFDVFLRCYGAEAGNLALKAGATSGLYVGGGIAAKNIGMMRDGRFIEAFAAKGRFEAYMRRIPVRVIMNQSAPLLGAALVAARAAGAMA